MAEIDGFFQLMSRLEASDLHLMAGQQPMLRVHGQIERLDYPKLEAKALRSMLYEITPETKLKIFEESGDVDFAYHAAGVGRLRANLFKQNRGPAGVFRLIGSKILSLEQLGLPRILEKFCDLDQGLVLVTGPTGSGKSSTLAAMIDFINRRKKKHILTIEDPLEFEHSPLLCSVNHRELGTHTESFGSALRGALREDPDIILLGEMRDLETISLALEVATTGHLVFSTLHTQSAPKTVDRIIDVFPSNEQEKVRVTLSECLRGVVAQALLPKKGGGRVAALELLFVNNAVSNLIREGKTFQITSVMQTQKKIGMQTLDDALLHLLMNQEVSPEAAYFKANNKELFSEYYTPKDEVFI